MEVEELEPIEVDPEFQEIEDEVNDASARMDEADEMAEFIRTEQAISRTVAVTLEAMDPELIPDGYLIDSYTQSPTATNLQPTLESIGRKVKEIIVKIYQAIKKFLKKIIEWAGKVIDRIKNLREKKTEAVAKAEQTSESIKKKEEAVSRDVSREKSNVERSALETVEDRYQDLFSGLTEDMMGKDTIRVRLKDVAESLADAFILCEAQIDALEASYKQLPRRSEELYENNELLKRHILASLDVTTRARDTRFDGFQTTEDLLDNAKVTQEELQQLQEEKFRTRFKPELVDDWFDYVRAEKFSANELDVSFAENLYEQSKDIGERFDKLERDVKKATYQDTELNEKFKQGLIMVERALMAYRLLASLYGVVSQEEFRIIQFVGQYKEAYDKHLDSAIREKGTDADKELLKD